MTFRSITHVFEPLAAAIAKIRERDLLIGILAIGLAARVAAALLIPDQSALQPDAASFRATAAEFLAHGRMSNPFWMPLYPLLIALFGHWQIATDIVLSVATIGLVYLLAHELFNDRWTAIFAALATACYPTLIYFSVIGLSETLFISLMLTTFLFWYRGQFVVASIFAVLTILTRPVFDVAPFVLVYFALVIHRLSLAETGRQVALYALVYCALMMPWWLNNYAVYGRFVHLNSEFGYQLYAGNNPLNTSGGAIQGVDFKLDQFAGESNLHNRDIAMRNTAFAYIVAHPKRFIELAGLKFIRMWRLWPINQGFANLPTILISIAAFAPVLLLAALGLIFARKNLLPLSPILLFGLGYTAIHMVFAGTIRYRVPLEPFLLILAASAVSRLLGNSVSVRSKFSSGGLSGTAWMTELTGFFRPNVVKK